MHETPPLTLSPSPAGGEGSKTILLHLLLLAMLGTAPSVAAQNSITELQKKLDRNPSDATTWLTLGRAYEEEGREGDAIRAYQRSHTRPEVQEALAQLLRFDATDRGAEQLATAAQQYDRAGNRSAADRCWREHVKRMAATNPAGATKALGILLERDPRDPKLSAELPDLFERCGRPAALFEKLSAFAQQAPLASGATVALADAEAARGNLRAAEQRLQDVLNAAPNADAYRSLARLWANTPERLVRWVQRLDSINSPHTRALIDGFGREPQAVTALLPHVVALLNRLSPGGSDSKLNPCLLAVMLAERADRIESAEVVLRKWLTVRRYEVYSALFLTYQLQGKYAEIETLSKLGLSGPGTPYEMIFYRYRARAYKHLNREDDAIAAADEALKRSTDEGRTQNRLLKIETLVWFGRRDEATAEAQKLLEESTTPAMEREARLGLASLAELAGDEALAEAHLERVLELAPGDVTAHNNLGYFWAERGWRLDEAERLIRYAVAHGQPADEDEPGGDHPAYRDSLGWVLFRRGRLTAARTELERALELPGGRRDATIWDHLGDVLFAQGKIAEARTAWSEALSRAERSRRSRDDPRPAELRRKINTEDRRMKE